MNLLINPGSGPIQDGADWTNTYEQARANAEEWYARMVKDGIRDVKLLDEYEERDGRWCFKFRHQVTGVVVELETHGIDNLDAYEKRFIFMPRVYWWGSSSSVPELEQWAAPGFEAVQTFRPVN